jgi:hypothetical protein
VQVFETVLIITLGTAALAAVIVALNFDLAAIAGWRRLVEGDRERLADRAAVSTTSPSQWQWGWPGEARPPIPVEAEYEWRAPPSAAPRAAGHRASAANEAERWLQAANANRLAEYQAGTYDETAAA